MGELTIRERFLEQAARFVQAAGAIPGVLRVALIGSIVTDKPNPKDIDLLGNRLGRGRPAAAGILCTATSGHVAGAEPHGRRLPGG